MNFIIPTHPFTRPNWEPWGLQKGRPQTDPRGGAVIRFSDLDHLLLGFTGTQKPCGCLSKRLSEPCAAHSGNPGSLMPPSSWDSAPIVPRPVPVARLCLLLGCTYRLAVPIACAFLSVFKAQEHQRLSKSITHLTPYKAMVCHWKIGGQRGGVIRIVTQ